jgi:hypothetical protein
MNAEEQQMMSLLLAFFNPTYERPEAAFVYCQAFHMLYGKYPPAWEKLPSYFRQAKVRL